MILGLAYGADRQIGRVRVLHLVTAETIHGRDEANDLLQEQEAAIDGDDQRLVRAFGSDDFEERLLGGDAVRLLEQTERQGVDRMDELFSTFGVFVFLEVERAVDFNDFVS